MKKTGEKVKDVKSDDIEQSERFEETAQKVGAVDDEKSFERAIQSVARNSNATKPKTA